MIGNMQLSLRGLRGRIACCCLCRGMKESRSVQVWTPVVTRNVQSSGSVNNPSDQPSHSFSSGWHSKCTNIPVSHKDANPITSIHQEGYAATFLPTRWLSTFLCRTVFPSPNSEFLLRQNPQDFHLPFIPKRDCSVTSHQNDPGTFHGSPEANTSGENVSNAQSEEDRGVLALCEALLARERWALARAITVVEATHKKGKRQAQVLLRKVLDHLRTKQAENKGIPPSFRIGLTGPPGAGKSTFIEALGKKLTAEGHRVAVLAVDPSSSITGGSILGDKTRMTELSRDPNAYIRASPSSGTLGGVTRNTNDTIVLCEAAGYDTILVETVGVGQSEYVVADMVDMLVLLIPPAGGDELQGLKKGIVELADFILVNKADGELLIPARRIRAEYTSAVKLMHKRSPLWIPKVKRVSSKTGDGLDKAWETMIEYREIMQDVGELMRKRESQRRVWMWQHIKDRMMESFLESTELAPEIRRWEREVMAGRCTSGIAADELLKKFSKLHRKF